MRRDEVPRGVRRIQAHEVQHHLLHAEREGDEDLDEQALLSAARLLGLGTAGHPRDVTKLLDPVDELLEVGDARVVVDAALPGGEAYLRVADAFTLAQDLLNHLRARRAPHAVQSEEGGRLVKTEAFDEAQAVLRRFGQDLFQHAGLCRALVQRGAVLGVEAVLRALDDPDNRVVHDLHPAQLAVRALGHLRTEYGPLPTSA